MYDRIITRENTKPRFIFNGETYYNIYLFSIGNIILQGDTYEELIYNIKKKDPYGKLSNKYIYK